MKTKEECASETEQLDKAIVRPRREAAGRMLVGIALSMSGLVTCGPIAASSGGNLYDPIYGNNFPFTPFFMALSIAFILGGAVFLANFRLVQPKRFVREVIAWLVLLYVAFGFHCLAAYLFYGDGMAFPAAVRGFCERVFNFSFIIVVAVFIGVGIGGASLLNGWVLKNFQSRAKRGKTVKRPKLFQKLDGLIDRYPARIVTGTKEYICLFARYVIWGTLLSLLILEVMIVSGFAMRLLESSPDPAYESSFELDSFEGEKFGSVLPGDVVRKKLAEPIGAIDELMLQADGNPARRLVYIYGQKFLGDVSDEEANDLAEKTCAALQKLIGVELRNVRLGPYDGFRRLVFSDQSYVRVKWDNHFFQKGKVLRLEVGLRNVDQWHDHWLKVDEVMGYKIGEPVGGDGTPKTPFWKFECIVNQCASNRISDGVYAVHDVSDLKREDAVKELEEARKAVEKLHGIKMFQTVDGDDVKQYDYYGDDVDVSVKLEYLRKKQIRYAVLAKGEWLDQIHGMPPPGGHAQRSRGNDTIFFLSFMVVVVACIIWLMCRIHRKKKEAK